MEVEPRKPTIRGPAEWFTGEVWIDSIAASTRFVTVDGFATWRRGRPGCSSPAISEPEEGTSA